MNAFRRVGHLRLWRTVGLSLGGALAACGFRLPLGAHVGRSTGVAVGRQP